MTLRTERLRCDDLEEPLGLDDRLPTLSWEVRSTEPGQRQVACEVQFSRDESFGTVFWASGARISSEPRIEYDGEPLTSRLTLFWRVRVHGVSGLSSPWSDPARFGIGLLDRTDWTASWITHPEWAEGNDPEGLPMLACDFDIAGPIRSARLYIAGLGVYVPSLNGQPVTDAVLEPPYSDFRRTIDYSTHDVTALIRQGSNVLGIRLGPGIAHVTAPSDRYTKFAATIARPRALAQLEVVGDDGTVQRVATGTTWRTTLGPTRRSHWFGGEEFDARLADPDWDRPAGDRSSWVPAVEVTWDVELAARAAPPLRIVDARPAVAVTTPAEGVRVIDLGVNIAGWPLLQLNTTAGRRIRIVPGEVLDKDGLVSQQEIGTPVESIYTTTDGEQRWHPDFMYHGFRYLEVHGLPDDSGPEACIGLVVRADNQQTGRFSCSDDVLNGVHRIIDRAVQGNMFSVLTDCPHREKLGWLEETQLLFNVVSHGYDVRAYYRDLVRRMASSQLPNGLVPDIAPEFVVFDGGFRDDPNWGGAIILAPWQMYRTYGDRETLRTYYPQMSGYLAYLRGRSVNGLLDHGLGDWYSLEEPPPRAAVATWGYLRATDALANIAEVLGETGDADEYRELAGETRAAFHDRFFDGTDSYGSGQAANALALDIDAVPTGLRAAVAERLAESVIASGNHLMVGEVSLPAVLRALSAGGYDDLIYQVATRTDWPSYGYQLKHGATALTEAWDGPTTGASQNHFMLGAIDDWFVRRLAGIDQAPESVGYRRAVIRPGLVGRLTGASATIGTPYGELAGSWTRSAGQFSLDVEIPVGVEADVHLPAPQPGQRLDRPAGCTALADGSFRIGSGHWSFRVSG